MARLRAKVEDRVREGAGGWRGRHGHLFQNRYKFIVSDPDLVGGELVRSLGGWSQVKSPRRRDALRRLTRHPTCRSVTTK